MSQRVKSISRIAQLIDHQNEVIEMQVLQIRKKLHEEESHLAALKNQLTETIGTFEKDISHRSIITNLEMTYLFGVSSFLGQKIKQKIGDVSRIGQELLSQEVILLEAYRKKKAFDVFKNKITRNELKGSELLEQKSQDYSNLINRLKR